MLFVPDILMIRFVMNSGFVAADLSSGIVMPGNKKTFPDMISDDGTMVV